MGSVVQYGIRWRDDANGVLSCILDVEGLRMTFHAAKVGADGTVAEKDMHVLLAARAARNFEDPETIEIDGDPYILALTHVSVRPKE